MSERTCADCGLPRDGRGGQGCCGKCYMKRRRVQIRADGGRPCVVDGCERRIWTTGRFCEMHAHRWERHREVGPADSVLGRRGTPQKHIPRLRKALLEAQQGKCLLCGTTETKQWCVDHDYRCCPKGDMCDACIRGVLCYTCNVALGMLHDDPALLRKAADYIASRIQF